LIPVHAVKPEVPMERLLAHRMHKTRKRGQ
jgi:hypothetical protein